MKIGFNGLNRCFDFGLVRPKQTLWVLWNRSLPFGLVGGLWGDGKPSLREGLGGLLVA